MASLPNDYLARTYASVLGPVWHYVNEEVNKPLIVADDDISGTFTFIRVRADFTTGYELYFWCRSSSASRRSSASPMPSFCESAESCSSWP